MDRRRKAEVAGVSEEGIRHVRRCSYELYAQLIEIRANHTPELCMYDIEEDTAMVAVD